MERARERSSFSALLWAALAVLPLTLGAYAIATPPKSAPVVAPPRAARQVIPSPAEALGIWRGLNRGLERVYAERDLTLIPAVFTSSGPAGPVVAGEVARLKTDGVLSLTRFDTTTVKLIEASLDELVIEQRVRITPRFMTEKGRDVTTSAPIVQRVRWVLRQQSSQWLLHQGRVVDWHEA